MRVRVCGVVFVWLVLAGSLFAQPPDEFSRKNTWTVFAEYSNTSSHILMGSARQRKIVDLGGAYTRRVVRFWGSDLSYHVEVRPVMFESDPLNIETGTYVITSGPNTGTTSTSTNTVAPIAKCQAYNATGTTPALPPDFPSEAYTITGTCGRQWTFAQAFSPLGFKYSMRTRHPVQPFIVGTLGYMYSSRPIPVSDAEALNFIFNFGAGVEVFRSKKRSVSLECRFSHFSNRDTAQANPGVDNVTFKASYSFGH
jgi:Lipid A 3-O-deacylase (PagL)